MKMKDMATIAAAVLCAVSAAFAAPSKSYEGGYLWEANSSESGSKFTGSGIVNTIYEDAVELTGFFKFGNTTYTARLEGDSIFISPDEIVSTTSYGNAVVNRYHKEGNTWVAEEGAEVRGVFERGTLKIVDHTALTVSEGPYAGMRITYVNDPFTALRANGMITAPLSRYSPWPLYHLDSYPVQIVQLKNTVMVQNFCNMGKETVLNIDLEGGNSALLKRQSVFIDMELGEFATTAADFSNYSGNFKNCVSSANITCSASPADITWGEWMVCSEEDCYAMYDNAKLEYADGSEFRLPADGIKGISSDSEPVAVRYFDLAGKELSAPRPGVNIIVKILQDGTTSSEKVLLR